jgi:carboxylesterase type B
MFWIHGGGNVQGTGEDATFDGGSLVSRTDSVVVTINHRLNIFGYLGLDDTVKGNYGIADKIAALQWVHDNIAAFGGDPERVMIFGQSAGGASVIDLIKTPKAHGLFSSAISQSGGAGEMQTYTTAAAAVRASPTNSTRLAQY